MPFPFTAIGAQVPDSKLQTPYVLDERLVVRSAEQSYKRSTGELVFVGNVEADYGVTRVYANRLTLIVDNSNIRKAKAEGRVRVVDPEAEFSGSNFEFDWVTGIGKGDSISLALGEITVQADTIHVNPKEWTLSKVRLVPCHHAPQLEFSAESLTVVPDKTAIASKFGLSIQGTRLISLPSYRQNLGPQQRASNLPRLSFRGNDGIGLSWDYGFELASKLTVDASIDAFSKRQASGDLVVTKSFVKDTAKAASPRPRSDFAEPFTFGFFEDVGVSSWERERAYVAGQRQSISLASTWNQGREGLRGERISKPIELIFDQSGNLASGWAGWAQVRLQRLDPGSLESEHRSVVQGALLPPQIAITSDLALTSRADFRYQKGDVSDSGWVRGQIGLIANIHPKIQLGVAYSERSQIGTINLPFDRPIVDARWHARADLDLGSTQFSYLAKYSGGPLGWFDHEYKISQVFGCYEPFAIWKEKPRSFSFGIVFRPLRELDARQLRLKARQPGNRVAKERTARPKGTEQSGGCNGVMTRLLPPHGQSSQSHDPGGYLHGW